MYKGKVKVPSLGMVNDVVNVDKCSNKAMTFNTTINAFIEANKLRLSHEKSLKNTYYDEVQYMYKIKCN